MKILLLSVLAVAMIGLMVPSVHATEFSSYDFEMDIHDSWFIEEITVKSKDAFTDKGVNTKGILTDTPSIVFSNPEKTIQIFVIPNPVHFIFSDKLIYNICENHLGKEYFCGSMSPHTKYGEYGLYSELHQGWRYNFHYADLSVKIPVKLSNDPTIRYADILTLKVESRQFDTPAQWVVAIVADRQHIEENDISLRTLLSSFKPHFKSLELTEELLNSLPKHNELKYNCWYGPCEFMGRHHNQPSLIIENDIGFQYGIMTQYMQKNTYNIEELFPIKHGICVTETQSPDGTITKHSCPDQNKPFRVDLSIRVAKFDSLENIDKAIGLNNIDYYKTSDTFAKCSFQNDSGSRVDSTGGVKVEGDYFCIANNSYIVWTNILTHVHGPLYDQTENIAYAYTSNLANHVLENLEEQIQQSQTKIPSWIKNNAGWWAEGQIDDNSFVKGIEYLVKVGIIQVS